MDEIMGRVMEIDARPRQVHIEARIVEIQRNKVKDLGIQWGGYGYRSTDLVFPNTVGVYGGNTPGSTGNAVSLPPQSAIDPATGQISAAAQGLAVGVIMGDVAGTLAITSRLFALENAGVSRTLSNPKVVAVNGARAVIKSGKEIPYQASSANTGPSVQFKEAVISLTVTPLIMEDNRIRLKIDARKDEIDPALSVQGTPAIKKKEIITNVIVENGGSAALGGMVEGEDSDMQNRIPGLHDIPGLGWLFKSDRKVDNELELLVFITPTLIDKGAGN
jgi:type IV pilus assembly protein PilQ